MGAAAVARFESCSGGDPRALSPLGRYGRFSRLPCATRNSIQVGVADVDMGGRDGSPVQHVEFGLLGPGQRGSSTVGIAREFL